MTYQKKHNILLSGTIFLFIMMFAASCSSRSEKKKKGVISVTFPIPQYATSTDSLPFTFDLSNQAKLTWQNNKPGEYFCNVDYPFLNACIYCTYHAITPNKFRLFAEESRKLVYQHTAMATAINEKTYSNDKLHVYGILYEIQGNVATPLQIALTDSNRYFFNASLYFNMTPNIDSISPAVKYIQKDIMRMIESFKVNSK